jgi:hypothetical protein
MMWSWQVILFVLLQLLLGQVASVNSTLINDLVSALQARSSIFCITIITDNAKNNLDYFQLNLPTIVISLEAGTPIELNNACPNYIIAINDLKSIQQLTNPEWMTLSSTGKYVIIFMDQFVAKGNISILLSNGFFRKVVDVAVFYPIFKKQEKYVIYARNPLDEKNIVPINIWTVKSGYKYDENTILSKGRLQNLDGKQLTATSFEYAPFTYKDHPEDKKYQGFEVSLQTFKKGMATRI